MRPVLRLLPLSLCIALALPARAGDMPPNWKLCPARDPVPVFPDAQQAPEGLKVDNAEQPINIGGDDLSGTEDNPVFKGNVTLRRGTQFMGADQLTYDRNQDVYTAVGSIRYQGGGLRLVAARAEGNQATDSHSVDDVRYQLLARRGNGTARRVTLTGSDGVLYDGTYSTCQPEDRRWEVRAKRIDIDTEAGFAVAHDATLRIGRVPVLYLPWFRFPTDDQRRTGLLMPMLSNSSRNGLDWRQPVYLNLAPNYDATLTPRLMTSRGLQLGAQFRYLVEGGQGTVEAAYMPHDRLRDRSRAMFRYWAFQDVSPQWQARANLNWISDTRYLEDFSSSLDGLSQYSAYSEIGLYGHGRGWDAALSADRWQLADFTLTEAVLPYDRAPRAWVHVDRPLAGLLHWRLDAEAVRFWHPARPGGARLDLKPGLSLPLEGDAWFLTPTLAYRYTTYELDDALARQLGSRSPSRGQPILSVDAGLFFDRETRIKGKDYLQTIEPRLFYLRVPYADQTDMPVFDTQPLTFGWSQLFRDNRYSGADRQADANQVTLAVSTRSIRQSDGRERFSASLGQIHYLSASRVTLPNEPITEKGRSAWVVDANYAPTDRWTIGASYQWDPKFKRTDLASLRARYLLPEQGVVNLGYRYRRGVLEQTDLAFLYPVNANWSVVGRHYYSLRDRKTLESVAGVQWDSCCIAVRVVARRYVHNRAGELANALMFEFELKGMGSAGQDTQRILRRAILGYNRDDLYLVPPQTATGQPPSSTDIDDTTP